LQVSKGALVKAEWAASSRSAALLLTTNKGSIVVLDQFKRADREAVGNAIKAATGLNLETAHIGVSGSNYGSLALAGKNLALLDLKGETTAILPFSSISQVSVAGRHEIEVQFQEDDTLEREDEAVVEARFFIPPRHGELKAAAENFDVTSERVAAEVAGDDDGVSEMTPANRFRTVLADAAGIAGVVGDAIAEFPDRVCRFLAPRGRYTVEVYPTFIRLAGKSNEYKIAHSKISRMYYLPQPGSLKDEEGNPVAERFYFVISLDDPVRQGQQRYPHLVLLLDRDSFSCRLNQSPEQLKERGLPGTITDTLPMVFATVLKTFTGKKIYRSQHFKSAQDTRAVRCALKSQDGFLFPLDRGMFFVPKPATFIRYSDVETVEFTRVGAGAAGLAARTFDMKVVCRASAGEGARDQVFVSIERAEYPMLKLFLHQRGIRIETDEDSETAREERNRLADAAIHGKPMPEDAGKTKSKRRAAKVAAVKSAADQMMGGGDDDDEEDEEDGAFGPAEDDDDEDDDDEDDDEDDDDDDDDDDGAGASSGRSQKRSRDEDDDDSDAKRAKSDDDDDDDDE
jgi:structure-specific recognition protein 1